MIPSSYRSASDRLRMFDVIDVNDPTELDSRSRLSSRLSGPADIYRYQLQDHALLRMDFDRPIFTLAHRGAGSILVGLVHNRFATENWIERESDHFSFNMPRHGYVTLTGRGEPTTGTASCGLVYRSTPDMRILTSDASTRATVLVNVSKVEEALEHMLDKRLRKPLEFRPSLDWSCGLMTSLKFQFDFVRSEFERPDGVADNAVALSSATDLLIALILRGAPHSYTDQLELGPGSAVPVYVRRA